MNVSVDFGLGAPDVAARDSDTIPAANDVFVSYAREELEFVKHLEMRLAPSGLTLWFDEKGLFAGEPFWTEITNAIDAAAAVVFVITPESIASVYCQRELTYAAERQKRIVPVLRREAPSGSAPDAIAGLQWVFLRDGDEQKGIEDLQSAIRADWLWLRQHARLITRGTEWFSAGKDQSRLLRGHDLRTAEAWLQEEHAGRERAISLQHAFIAASRRATTQRRLTIAASVCGATAALAVAALLAANYYVATLNDNAQDGLEKETSENVVSARDDSARAVAVCRYQPLHTTQCDSARVNLGVAERAVGSLDTSHAELSRVINRFATTTPRTDAQWVSLASAYWERAVTMIALAEAAPNEEQRASRYALASADMTRAESVFERFPEEGLKRPLGVTRARLMLAAGSYERAVEELNGVRVLSPEHYLVLSIAYLCLHRLDLAASMRDEWFKAIPPPKTESPEFKRELPFFERNSKCIPLPQQ